jgi:hypothetical protein
MSVAFSAFLELFGDKPKEAPIESASLIAYGLRH